MKISRFHLKLQTGIDLTQMYQSAVLDRQLGIIFNLLLLVITSFTFGVSSLVSSPKPRVSV